MHCQWNTFLAILPTLLTIATCNPLPAQESTRDPIKLKPIRMHDAGASSGVGRRDSEQFSKLDPSTQAELIYGTPGDHSNPVLANMTLYAQDGLPIVLLEKFDEYTSAIDCNGDDGTMSLTFKSQSAFDYALKTWSYVNKKEEDKFLLIANHEGCSPANRRQPYLISKVTEDSNKFTTTLAAKNAPWSEIAESYEMDFGKPIAHSKSNLTERGLWGDITGAVHDVGDAVTGSVDLSKSITFGVNAGTPNKVTNIYTDKEGRFAMDCINCFIQGNFQVSGHLNVHHFHVQEFSIDASPQNFMAELKVQARVQSDDNPTTLEYSVPVMPQIPIPDAAIDFEIFKLGAFLGYEVGAAVTFSGEAIVDLGVKAQLPDSAQLTADLHDPSGSSASGFQGAVEPIFEIEKFSAGLTVGVFTQPKLSLEIEVEGVGHAAVAILLKLPQVSATLTGEYDENGVCTEESSEGATSKTGIKLSSEVATEVDLALEVGWWPEEFGSPALSKKLFGISVPLYEHCYPLNIGGSGDNTGKTPESRVALPGAPQPPYPVSGTAAVSGKAPTAASSSIGKPPYPISGSTGGTGTGTYPTASARYPTGTASAFQKRHW